MNYRTSFGFALALTASTLLSGVKPNPRSDNNRGADSAGVPPGDGYVVAADRSTGRADWAEVVEALRKKHDATVIRYDGKDGLPGLLAELKKLRPKYVCFVAPPEGVGRDFVKAAYDTLRRIDDDPYGDAIWGIVTGYDAADALKLVKAPRTHVIRSFASSMGGDRTLDGFESGFASDERSADNFWMKRPGGKNGKIPTDGNPAKTMAAAFNTIPVDYFMTSGHARERDWQIVYNQNKGSLVHTKAAGLEFVEPGGKIRHALTNASLKVYVGAGNCLIGHVDVRACMATAWMRTAGVEQFAGYTVPSWFGFMGWGTAGLFGSGRYSLAEARYLTNERLIWTKLRKHPASADRGLDWDRDTFAFYGDPAQRILHPTDSVPYTVAVEGDRVTVRFTRDCDFAPLDDVRGANPVMALLASPPPGDLLVDGKGIPVLDAVVTERFLFIPATGRRTAGETYVYGILDSRTVRSKPSAR